MNIIERIEKQVEAGGTSAYFHIRSDDVRAVLRLVKAVQAKNAVYNATLPLEPSGVWKAYNEENAALAALEAPCE